jgi:UDP-glucose 6-dehydrogenase
MTLKVGDTVPVSFNNTAAYKEHVLPLINQLKAAADEHDIALTVIATTQREREQKDKGFVEEANTHVTSVNLQMHSSTVAIFMIALQESSRNANEASSTTQLLAESMMKGIQVVEQMTQETFKGTCKFL